MKLVEKRTELMIILQKENELTNLLSIHTRGGEAAHDNTVGERVDED